MTKIKKRAFTLTEVLIAVGIIGIVAAITIPNVIKNTNNKRFTTQLKKSIATLSQASRLSNARYDVDYANISADSSDASCANDRLSNGQFTMCALFNETLSGNKYLGTYGSVSGGFLAGNYEINKTNTGF